MTYAVLRIDVTGTRSLLMHNGKLASQLPGTYEPADMLKKISAKRTKTPEDRWAMAEIEFRGGLYYDEGSGVYVPADNLIKSLQLGAARLKKGKEVKRALSSDPDNPIFPLVYDGPNSIAGLWGDGKSPFVFTCPAKVGMAKIDRTRPIFPPPWSFSGFVLCDMSVFDLETIQRIAELAGKLEGVGTWREKYGRYNAMVSIDHEI